MLELFIIRDPRSRRRIARLPVSQLEFRLLLWELRRQALLVRHCIFELMVPNIYSCVFMALIGFAVRST